MPSAPDKSRRGKAAPQFDAPPERWPQVDAEIRFRAMAPDVADDGGEVISSEVRSERVGVVEEGFGDLLFNPRDLHEAESELGPDIRRRTLGCLCEEKSISTGSLNACTEVAVHRISDPLSPCARLDRLTTATCRLQDRCGRQGTRT
jgi:hypothetical protein